MKIFKDNKEIETLDLGIVEAGTSKEYEYELYNETIAKVVDLKITIPNKEVEVLTFPEKIDAKARGILKIRWSPSITLKQGLKTTIQIRGAELYK